MFESIYFIIHIYIAKYRIFYNKFIIYRDKESEVTIGLYYLNLVTTENIQVHEVLYRGRRENKNPQQP